MLRSMRAGVIAVALAVVSTTSAAVEIPKPTAQDPRLREVMYSPDQVYRVNIVLGVGTRIILAKDEEIVRAAPGFGADCKDDSMSWCIVADVGLNEIFVKAKSTAKEANNLEVTTNKRVYSFDFVLLETTKSRNKDAMFRVTFKYPEEAKKVDEQAAAAAVVQERLEAKTRPRNWNYTKEAVPGSDGIDPMMIFDDGRFTYFKFAGNKQMPEVFAIESDGSESVVATHVEGPGSDTLVAHRVGKRFVLRLDKQVVGIWNESFDQVGVAAPDGVTVEGLKRVMREQE